MVGIEMHYCMKEAVKISWVIDILDPVAVKELVKFRVTLFYHLFTEVAKWPLSLFNELWNMAKHDMGLSCN